jgi:hypothetical protein
MSGTSMASPHVAGAAAVLLSATPGLSPARLSERLLANSTLGVVTSGFSANRLLFSPPDGAIPQPPANDHYRNAIDTTFTTGPVTGSNSLATRQPGEPRNAGRAGGRSVWWRFTAPTTTTVTFSTYGSTFDTTLGVYAGARVDDLVELGSNDDFGNSLTSAVTINVVQGGVYAVSVDGYNGDWGLVKLSGIINNDFFTTAIPIGAGDQVVRGTNVGATSEFGEPAHAGRFPQASVWWSFTATANGPITVSTTGSNFDTVLAVYVGNSVGTLAEVASNDDSGGGSTSSVTFNATNGVTYRVVVDGYNGVTGSVVLRKDVA